MNPTAPDPQRSRPRSLRRRYGFALLAIQASLAAADSDTGQAIPSLEDLVATPAAITSASKRPQPAAEAPAAVSVIGADEIRAFGWRTLADALASMKGVYATNDRAYIHLGVRGFGRPGDWNARILLLINGAPINDGVYDQAPVGTDFPVDLRLVDRIEFVPGPGSVLYGGNALFAVVNVITRSEPSNSAAELAVGTQGETGAHVHVSGRSDFGTDWLAALTYFDRRGETLSFPAYAASGAPTSRAGMDRDAGAQAYARVDDGGLSVDLAANRRTKRTPGGPYGADLNDPRNLYRDTRGHFTLRYSRALDVDWVANLMGTFGAYYSDGDAVFDGVFERDALRSQYAAGEASLNGRLAEIHRATLGVSTRDDHQRHQYNVSPFDDDHPRRNNAAFAQFDWRIGAGTILSTGMRRDFSSEAPQETSHRLALISDAGPHQVIKLIAGRAFRPPNAFEAYYAYQGFNLPNPALRSEILNSVELFAERRLSNSWINASLYRNRIDHPITLQTDPAAPLQQHFNSGEVTTHGLEIEAGAHGRPGRVRANASWQRSVFADGAGRAELPNTPRLLGNLTIARPLALGGTHPVDAAVELKYLGRRRTDTGDIARQGDLIPAAWWANLTCSWRTDAKTSWQLRIDNLFDRSIDHVVGPEYSVSYPALMAYPMPTLTQDGRAARLSLRREF